MSSRFVTVFTDASHCPNTNATGWAAWIKHSEPPITIRFFGSTSGLTNSTAAESYAIQEAVKTLLELGIAEDKVVVIQSDSIGALDQWRASHKNQLAQELLYVADFVKYKHVKGHRGNKCPRSAVNSWCDRAAYEQMTKLRQQLRSASK